MAPPRRAARRVGESTSHRTPGLDPFSNSPAKSAACAPANVRTDPARARAVPAGAERGIDVCGDSIQPRSLRPVFAHLVPQGRRALGDAGFAAPDEQDGLDALLGLGR